MTCVADPELFSQPDPDPKKTDPDPYRAKHRQNYQKIYLDFLGEDFLLKKCKMQIFYPYILVKWSSSKTLKCQERNIYYKKNDIG